MKAVRSPAAGRAVSEAFLMMRRPEERHRQSPEAMKLPQK